MVSPGSANIAPPPLIRRTTVIPSRRPCPVSTSLRSDWKLPMMTAGAAHSQMRSVGGRRPAATSRASTSSIAMCSAGSWGASWMSCQPWSRQLLARVTARRMAMATVSAESPASMASPPRPASMLAVIAGMSAASGSPVTAASMRSSASSGSRKKSPLIRTSARRPPATSTSATTSLPPGALYSPCMQTPSSSGGPAARAAPGMAARARHRLTRQRGRCAPAMPPARPPGSPR